MTLDSNAINDATLKRKCAIIIQRAWRRHIDTQVYQYYRNIINFRMKGDPAAMLRCINPIESKILDASMGVRVKFRLAGEKFPPNIYYKIFTHRPIQDICANSPKDYTQDDCKLASAKSWNNKGNSKEIKENILPGAQGSWYKRFENNGWRQVSTRIVQCLSSDSVAWESHKKKTQFHHNPAQRKADLVEKKKQKKIEWLKKMYKDGMLKPKADDSDTIKLIDGTASGMINAIDKSGVGVVQEWEVDELLQWTTALSFDDYSKDWSQIATSAGSESNVEDRLLFQELLKESYHSSYGSNLENFTLKSDSITT